PRLPDAEGVVERISFQRITLDGGRSYGVRKDLQSFSTYDLAAVPMLHRLGQYVQLGLTGKKVAWMAGIGVVVRRSGAPPVVDSDLDAIVRVHNLARPLLADTVAALRARRAAGVALRDDVPWIRLVAELDGDIVATGRAIEASGGPVPEPGVVYAGIEVDPDV